MNWLKRWRIRIILSEATQTLTECVLHSAAILEITNGTTACRCALCAKNAPEAARVYLCRRHHAGSGDRRKYRHLQRHQCGAACAAALRQARRIDDYLVAPRTVEL